MQSVIRPGRRGVASSTGFLIALTVFGVLLMHSVTPAAFTTSMSSGHAAMASMTSVAGSAETATEKHDCPSAHQMMHPCVGTTVSWPGLPVPALSAEIGQLPTAVNGIGGRTDSTLERAPPWTLWELDRSVTLRV
ncbi:DUF6153 family protein [Rhodococcus sp. IEGM 1330]|uniref:DUF6153 family protein n=1 Tax=Rhodococcus sp. IEGM 1330 TaxID=3082225 RepID=UPI0029558CD7|nr:DUF6153 family protein [Rhodococcus sp. IEGM 1330]MDV8022676.1 DUF6153 family protein [Rhodococcus sp. IEGM 1330]